MRRQLRLKISPKAIEAFEATLITPAGEQEYFPFGIIEKPAESLLPREDKGRFAVTKDLGDEYVFRSAPLRNVGLRPPYFHVLSKQLE